MKRQKTGVRKVLRLRQLRRGLEMTQGQLAKRVHLSTSAINAIEKGKSKPSFDTAVALAAVFGVPIEEAFSYVEAPTS